MAPPGPRKPQWGVLSRQPDAFGGLDLEQGTKMWHEMLKTTDKHESNTTQQASHHSSRQSLPRVTGGLPPHLLRQRENTKAPESPPHTTQHVPLSMAPKQALTPSPTYDDDVKFVPLVQARPAMNPLLKKVVGSSFAVAVKQDPFTGSPGGRDRLPPKDKMKWRPQHSEDNDSQSLPSTAASVNLSQDESNRLLDTSQDGDKPFSKDIRANIADELDIVRKGNGDSWINKNAWKNYCNDPPSEDNDDDGDSFVKGWKATFCDDWVAGLPEAAPPSAFCLDPPFERHWECDIDTKNGFLISPVEYPVTQVNPKDPCSGLQLDRRLRGTAAMRVATEYAKMHRRVLNRERKEMELNAQNPPPHFIRKPPTPSATPQLSPVAAIRPFAEAVQQPGQASVAAAQVPVMSAREAVHEDLNLRRVKVPCHIRPASPADAPQILEIYNWEVMNGHQALDGKPLTVQDIERLLMECKSAKTPFIVAVQGTPLEAVWKKETPAPPRGPYKQARPTGPYEKAPEFRPEPDKILGFGFISCPMSGLAGDVHENVGRFIGKVQIYVEVTSRRNNIGRALLHKLTRCCSKAYFPVDWYDWYDPLRIPVFDEPDFNPRNYSRLYIETSSTGEKDPNNAWYEKFLDSMDYLFMSTLDKTRKIGHGQDGEWLDTIVWQHDCREPKTIRETV